MKRIFLFFVAIFMVVSYAFASKIVTVKAGTVVLLQAVKQVKAADVEEGDVVDFRVASNVVVDNIVAIPAGTLVHGRVEEAKRSSLAGTKGRLTINISRLVLPSGDQIFFSGSKVKLSGENRTPLAVVTALFFWPCIFIPGSKAVMPEGYEVNAIVMANADIHVND